MIGKVKCFAVMGVMVLLLIACGSSGTSNTTGEEPAPVGDAAGGEKLFTQATIGTNNAPGCITCHALEPDVVIVGPSQAGLATRAESRVAGMSAEQYIHESIVNPNSYVVEGFAQGVMYQYYADDLTEDEINDLVAFALTLK